ncbi:Lar family restriction alleviation protein [Paraburkholderia hospita]|uniref:Restriction alleviation protein Lar n=1 Tax=Paraburkholderia hospita TaxID=169430 RepID=A0ABN0FKF1_9BURK|nr:Lar family restriction alleviation protein [Paraburkholderia hospita]EIM99214.1 hypothetical protein WQE_20231 [Paraburkholderia hospita]OUL72497.1 hypothetical protein CA602_43460 [Paraburkholderia hospita]OUL80705.1 hypothetical protein CA603_31370 [Paraburkholderia hospita]OUL94110.1 hypothetical protein CA601_09055 [Paraburkholderia hospita]
MIDNIKSLLPCPFCGGTAEIKKIEEGCFGVGCPNCDFQLMNGQWAIGWHKTKERAATEWNRRSNAAPVADCAMAKDAARWKIVSETLSMGELRNIAIIVEFEMRPHCQQRAFVDPRRLGRRFLSRHPQRKEISREDDSLRWNPHSSLETLSIIDEITAMGDALDHFPAILNQDSTRLFRGARGFGPVWGDLCLCDIRTIRFVSDHYPSGEACLPGSIRHVRMDLESGTVFGKLARHSCLHRGYRGIVA